MTVTEAEAFDVENVHVALKKIWESCLLRRSSRGLGLVHRVHAHPYRPPPVVVQEGEKVTGPVSKPVIIKETPRRELQQLTRKRPRKRTLEVLYWRTYQKDRM